MKKKMMINNVFKVTCRIKNNTYMKVGIKK